MCWIKDSLHGEVRLTKPAEDLLATEDLQRLRRIQQTTFSNFIYPGANQTRLEHSIGTYYLTGRSCFLNRIPNETAQALCIAAFLHDIGHPAFSHGLEKLLIKHLGKDHEDFTKERIKRGEVKEMLELNSINPDDIIKVYDSPLGKIIDGGLGTDRMDYLLRDAYYTGVAYGSVELDQILRKTKLVDNKVILEADGVSAAEAMLVSRFQMYVNVYRHPVAVSARQMILRATDESINMGVTRAEELATLDDWQLMARLVQQEGTPGKLARLLSRGKTYATGSDKLLRDFKNWLYLGDLSAEDKAEIERYIAEKADIHPHELILYISPPLIKDPGVTVLKDGDYYSLNETSLMTRLLKEAQWDYAHVTAYCPVEHKEKVAKVGLSVLEEYGEG